MAFIESIGTTSSSAHLSTVGSLSTRHSGAVAATSHVTAAVSVSSAKVSTIKVSAHPKILGTVPFHETREKAF